MKLNLAAWILLACWLGISPAFGQKPSDVTVVYDLDADAEELDAMSRSMLQGGSMTMMFLGKKLRVEMDMQMMSTTTITDDASGTGIVLMDLFGQKMYKLIDGSEVSPDGFEVKKGTGSKMIAGYKAEEYFVTTPTGEQFNMWVTSEIVPGATNKEMGLANIKGLPLEMDITQGGMSLHLVARSVDLTKPDAALFVITPPEGYVEMND